MSDTQLYLEGNLVGRFEGILIAINYFNPEYKMEQTKNEFTSIVNSMSISEEDKYYWIQYFFKDIQSSTSN